MSNYQYYFERHEHHLKVGEFFDEFEELEHQILKFLADEYEYEEIASYLKMNEQEIEEICERLFKQLKPVAQMISSKVLKESAEVTDEEKILILEAYVNEMSFREERARYVQRGGRKNV